MKIYILTAWDKESMWNRYFCIADTVQEAIDLFMKDKPKRIHITFQDDLSFFLSNGLRIYITPYGEVKKGSF